MTEPHITILMATCNGARFLAAQLDSLIAQTYSNWSLLISDDGSLDDTPAILQRFDKAHPGRVLGVLAGPRRGSAAQNFMALLHHPLVPKGLVALADQDDVWLPQKLRRAVDHMAGTATDLPAIYASESILTNAKLRPLARTCAPNIVPGFRNALVQNLFAGHSTVLNGAALCLVQKAGIPRGIAFHDWWLYQLIAASGGICLLDPAQTVLYRQHGSNAFGAADGVKGTIRRVRHLLRNDYAVWLRAHWNALNDVATLLTPEARFLLHDLLERPLGDSRASQFRRLRLRRGTTRGTAALWFAAGLGRV